MADQPKPKLSPATLAAFLAGAGFGVGTEVIIKPAVPEEPGWSCSVLSNDKVFCREVGAPVVLGDDLRVRIDSPDAGTPDAGFKDAGE